jgi:ADP-ribose pyrophosphatase
VAGELDPWVTRTRREVYRNPWLRLEEHVVDLPNGRDTLYGIVRCSPCVGMLPFTDPDTVLLVGQYRYIIERPTWEMPTGGQHPDESPETAAQRELAEEVGVNAATLTRLTAYNTSKSVVDETATLFIATDLTPAEAPPDDTELLVRRTFAFEEALAMTLSGEIVDGMSVIAILWADRLRRLGLFPA